MAYKMKDLRNLDMNLYYFVTSGISVNGYTILSGYDEAAVTSGIFVIDAYPNDPDNIKVPSVAVEHASTRGGPLQLGPGREDRLQFNVEVYAGSDGERDDLGEMIRLFFEQQSMPIRDLNEFLISGNEVEIGKADFENIVMFPLRGDSTQRALNHRMHINVDCIVTIPSGTSLIT